jgi:hypothetical protein
VARGRAVAKPRGTRPDHRTSFFRSKSFLEKAIREGEALRDLYSAFARNPGDVIELYTTMHAGSYSFVLALHQASRWLPVLATHDRAVRNLVRGFVAALPDLKELRDMFEHELKYASGRGNRQERWLRKVDPDVSIMQEATGAFVFVDANGRWTHRIGGRLDVSTVTESATRLLKVVDEAAVRLPPLGPAKRWSTGRPR